MTINFRNWKPFNQFYSYIIPTTKQLCLFFFRELMFSFCVRCEPGRFLYSYFSSWYCFSLAFHPLLPLFDLKFCISIWLFMCQTSEFWNVGSILTMYCYRARLGNLMQIWEAAPCHTLPSSGFTKMSSHLLSSKHLFYSEAVLPKSPHNCFQVNTCLILRPCCFWLLYQGTRSSQEQKNDRRLQWPVRRCQMEAEASIRRAHLFVGPYV